MTILFREYELLSNSGLFDADYYLRVNPDVAAGNLDPLLHYLETGASELRNPSEAFDAQRYVEECRQRGENVGNPLLHFISRSQISAPDSPEGPVFDGATRAVDEARRESRSPGEEALQLGVDQILIEERAGAAQVTVVGWCLAATAITELSVTLGDAKAQARYGLPRPDVARAFPKSPRADHAGFKFSILDTRTEPEEDLPLIFTARDASGGRMQRRVIVQAGSVQSGTDVGAETAAKSKHSLLNRAPMQLFVDECRVDERGILHIIGWAVCLAPIASVQVSVDEALLASAEYGLTRDDVASSHAGYPNALHSGFALHMDVSELSGGDRVVTVRATASTGIAREALWPLVFPAARGALPKAKSDAEVQLYCEVIEVTTAGRISLKGWAVAAAVTEVLAVSLDGEPLGVAQVGLERSDVGNHFPQLPHARHAGFSFRHRGAPIEEGEHLLVLRHRCNGRDTDVVLPVQALAGATEDAEEATTIVPGEAELRLSIDLPAIVDGAMPTPVRSNLEVVGWAVARRGTAAVDIAIDGERVLSAYSGIRRRDVQRALPDWEGALNAGFSALLPHRTLPKGPHVVSVTLRDQTGTTARADFRISVEDAPDTDGPWALRRRMTPAEIELISRPLRAAETPPTLALLLPLVANAQALERARTTLQTLARQAYAHWRLYIVTPQPLSEKQRDALLAEYSALAEHIECLSGVRTLDAHLTKSPSSAYWMRLRPGDELGCDALLQFAVHAVLNPGAPVLYSDERRLNIASDKLEAFFKPRWSPDLLLSMNYLGRAWCVRIEALRSAGIDGAELLRLSDHELALRATEQANAIRHLPLTLLQAMPEAEADAAAARQGLTRTLRRRGLDAVVEPGRTPGSFRVQRYPKTEALVSIIIPTCAARGLIRTCLDSLRAQTAYRHFEIVCIENIPADKPEWKQWLRENADRVVETQEPFNWSRFNNLAVEASRGEFLLFLNDDIEIIDPQWLQVLLSEAERPEIGVVGPQLLYPDRRVQHAGMFLAGLGVARHAFRYAAADEPCYFGLALVQREVSAVTGACLMTRRSTFEALGRFDETHDVVNNDIDFCLRVQQRGLRTLYTPHAQLIHHELASRAELADSFDTSAFESRWRTVYAAGDPYFHPRLAIDRDDYANDWEPVEAHCAGYPFLPRDAIKHILVVKLDHIGDCVIALPAVRRLKQHFPDAKLTVLTGRASKAIWSLERAVDELLEFDFFHARSGAGMVERSEEDWAMLRSMLVPRRFDLAIDLRKHWETRAVLQHTGARYTAGYDMKGKFPWLDVALEWSEDVALLRKRQHTSDDLVNLVDAVAAACEGDRAIIARPPRVLSAGARLRIPQLDHIFSKRVVCVHPTAGNEMKQWPSEYFGALIDLLIDLLIELEDVHVILIGGPDEEEFGTQILASLSRPQAAWSIIGRLPLAEIPALIARCALFVGNDSGPKHIAAGLGVPTVGIHSGVVDAREWGPKGVAAVALQRAMTCAPCYHSKLDDCPRALACVRGLMPASVLEVCRQMLAGSAERSTQQPSRKRLHQQTGPHP